MSPYLCVCFSRNFVSDCCIKKKKKKKKTGYSESKFKRNKRITKTVHSKIHTASHDDFVNILYTPRVMCRIL